MSETLFEELKRYVDFDDRDQSALRAAYPTLQPHFQRISEKFYDRILTHEGARKALEGGESMVGRLKVTLVAWMGYLLQGPWDEKYFETRARIGRVHVRIALPQHYMFGAMNVIRREFGDVIERDLEGELRADVRRAVNKIIDLELAIMLHTYREDLLSQQARVERLSTFGQLVGSIGHELRNPLGVIESSVYILRKQLGAQPNAAKHLDRIGEQLGLASHIISDLLDMIRDRPLQADPVPLGEVLRDAASAVAFTEARRLHLHGLEDLGLVLGDRNQLRQVFVNLLENAAQAVGESGEVFVEAARTGGKISVGIEDTGPGLAPNVRQRLFEPLITTKARGIGLGLPLVKRIVERHGGTIAHRPRGKGARFVVELPGA